MAAPMTCIKSSSQNGASMLQSTPNIRHINDIDIEKCTIALSRFIVDDFGALHYYRLNNTLASVKKLIYLIHNVASEFNSDDPGLPPDKTLNTNATAHDSYQTIQASFDIARETARTSTWYISSTRSSGQVQLHYIRTQSSWPARLRHNAAIIFASPK
jgi:hypothetical protein